MVSNFIKHSKSQNGDFGSLDLEQSCLEIIIDFLTKLNLQETIFTEFQKDFKVNVFWKVIIKFLEKGHLSRIPIKDLKNGCKLLDKKLIEPLLIKINPQDILIYLDEFYELIKSVADLELIKPLVRFAILFPQKCFKLLLEKLLRQLVNLNEVNTVRFKSKLGQFGHSNVSEPIDRSQIKIEDFNIDSTETGGKTEVSDHNVINLYWLLSKIIQWEDMEYYFTREVKGVLSQNEKYNKYELWSQLIDWLFDPDNFQVLCNTLDLNKVLELIQMLVQNIDCFNQEEFNFQDQLKNIWQQKFLSLHIKSEQVLQHHTNENNLNSDLAGIKSKIEKKKWWVAIEAKITQQKNSQKVLHLEGDKNIHSVEELKNQDKLTCVELIMTIVEALIYIITPNPDLNIIQDYAFFYFKLARRETFCSLKNNSAMLQNLAMTLVSSKFQKSRYLDSDRWINQNEFENIILSVVGNNFCFCCK